MEYNDDDEKNNLYYIKYKTKKIKPKTILNEEIIEEKTNENPRTRNRKRHDSSSSSSNNSSNGNKSKLKSRSRSNDSDNNNTDKNDVNIPENKDNSIINKILINKEHQKYKLIQENYKNLSSWSGGTTNITNTTTTKSKITIQHENNDPMKHILNPTTSNNNNNEPILNNSITQSRGFYLPKCKYTAPVNRFGILPGYRWDGVDRSNGFEKKYFETQNKRSAQAIEYFKIRSEDL